MCKAAGAIVVSAYVTCPDITKVITPDIKRPGESRLIYIDLANGKYRLGGSALAHVYGQIGNESPDIEDSQLLKHAFNAIQKLISENLILAGHDRSDGGLITTLLGMAFGGVDLATVRPGMAGVPQGLIKLPPQQYEGAAVEKVHKTGTPGTVVLVAVLLGVFVLYYYTNWKMLAIVWKVG